MIICLLSRASTLLKQPISSVSPPMLLLVVQHPREEYASAVDMSLSMSGKVGKAVGDSEPPQRRVMHLVETNCGVIESDQYSPRNDSKINLDTTEKMRVACNNIQFDTHHTRQSSPHSIVQSHPPLSPSPPNRILFTKTHSVPALNLPCSNISP